MNLRIYALFFLLTGCDPTFYQLRFHDTDATPENDAKIATDAGADSEASDAGSDATPAMGTGGAPGAGGARGSGGAPGAGGAPGGRQGAGGSISVTTPEDACVPVTHDSGTGQTWKDCVPLGARDQAQARKACEAWCDWARCTAQCWSSIVCGRPMILGETKSPEVDLTLGWNWGDGTLMTIDVNQSSCVVSGKWN